MRPPDCTTNPTLNPPVVGTTDALARTRSGLSHETYWSENGVTNSIVASGRNRTVLQLPSGTASESDCELRKCS